MLAADAVLGQLGFQFIPSRLKAIGDVLEKEQPEDDVLVLGGINLPAKSVGGFPEGVGVGEVGDVFVGHAWINCSSSWRSGVVMAIIGLDLLRLCDATADVRFHGIETSRNSPRGAAS